MNERIKKLRNSLDLTQQEFANRLNIKRNTLANYEVGRNIPIDAVVSLICREFKVSEQWLRTGEGEMFVETETTTIDRLCAEYNTSELETALLRAYFKINPKIRTQFIQQLFSEISPAHSADIISDNTIDAEVESYRQELLAERKGVEKSKASPLEKDA